MSQILDLGTLGKHEFPDDATPEEIQRASDELVAAQSTKTYQDRVDETNIPGFGNPFRQPLIKSPILAPSATPEEEEDWKNLGLSRTESAQRAVMQGGGAGTGKTISGFARLAEMLSAGQLLEASGRAVNPETSKALLEAGLEKARQTPEQREADVQKNPVYRFGSELSAGAQEAFPKNPAYRSEFFTDVIPSAAGEMVPTIAAGAINPALAATQYGLSSGESGAQEAVAAGDLKDTDKVFLTYLGLGGMSEFALGVPANVLKYLRAAKSSGVDRRIARETVLKMMGKAGLHEAGQESLEQVGQNVVAQQTFDPNRSTMEGVPESAAAGFILGAPIGGGSAAIGSIPERIYRKRRLTLARDIRSSPEWRGYIEQRGQEEAYKAYQEKLPEIAKARAEAARNHVNNSVADRTEVPGVEVRLAGARDRMADFGYIFDEAADVYRPARITQGGQNANQTGTPTQAASAPAGPVEEAAGSLRVRNAPQNRVEAPAGEAPAEDVKSQAIPDWAREEMIRRGLNPGRTFNDIDLQNPSVRDAIQSDPTLTDDEKAQLLNTGSTKPNVMPKGGVPNVQEEKGRKAVLKSEAQDQPEPPKTQTIADPSQQPIFEVPLDQITLSKDVPNFKKKANESGVVEENKLGGKYERLGTAPIVLWKRKNGSLEVITGRHRLDLARRSGEQTIPAQIVEEEKGFTRQQALVFDAASNIRDGQGDVEDYADFFRNTPNLGETEALKGGLLARAKGRSGWNIGKSASNDVYALFKAGKISSAQAEAISLAAPNNTSAQAIGSRYAVIGRDPDFVSNIIKASLNQARVQNVDLDLFGNDNSVMAAMEEMAYAASKIVSGLRDQIQAVSNAAKRPKLAAKLGVDVKDPAGVQNRIKQLRADLERWNNWPTQPDLVAQLKASTSQPQPASPTPAPSTPVSQQVNAGKRAPLTDGQKAEAIASMSADVNRLMKLREKLGKGAKELSREASKFINWLVANRSVQGWQDITNADLLEWASNGFEGRELDAQSRNKYVNFARQILEQLSADNPSLVPLLKSVAFEPMKAPPKVEGSQGKFFPIEATAKLVAPETSSDPYLIRDKAFFALMRYTGFRVEDVARIKLSDVDLEKGLIRNSLISKRNVILPMRAIPALAVFNIRRYLDSGARGMLGDASSEYLFPGVGKKGFVTVGNMLQRIQKFAEANGIKLANDADAQTTAFRNTFAQDLTVSLRNDKVTLNELAGRVGEDVSEKNYLGRHSDPNWIENVNRTAVSALPENAAFIQSPEARGEVQLPKADPSFLQWKQRLKGKRNLAQPSPGLSGKALQRYYQLRDKESLTLPEQREFERLSNVNQGGLFQDEAATAVQQSAKLRAAQLRQQAEENERLAGLRYDAYSRGSQKAYGEYQAYTKEADRLRKLAIEFDKQAGVYTRSELPEESKRQSPQLDLFGGANLTLPDGSYNPSVRRNRRIMFSPSENGFSITYGKNEFGEGTREIRVETPEDLMFLVSHESLNISDDLRAALKGIAASNMVKHFPGLGFAITTFIEGSVPGGATYRGEHLPEQRLIRLLNAASAKDAAHEFMHHLQYYLRPEDREWIRVQRQLVIRRELRKARNAFEIGTLEKLLKEQLSSDAYLEQRHSRDLYHLANEFEFWAWMMTDRAAVEFTQPTERGFIQRIRDAIKQWFYALRKYANLTSRDEEIWNQVIKGTYTYSADMRFQYNQESGRNLSVPADEPAYNMGDRLDIETAWAQIDKASRLTIPELAQSKLDDYRSAISELEANEFDTKRYRAANDKLKELATEAQKLAMRSGDEFWETEDGQAWLSPSNENFGAALFRLNVAFDPEALRGLQTEIRFERRSRNLSGMRRRLQATEQTIETLQSMGWEDGDYLEFTKTAERLRKSIGKLESDPDADNAGGLTVSERADQIDELRGSMIDLRAKRDALNLPFVHEVFESDDESGGVPVERLSRALKGFTAAMKDGNLHQSYKDASAKLLWDNLSKLEMAQKEFSKFSEARRQQISKAIRSARVKLADANIEYGIQKIFEDELLRVANNNERGLTGTLSGREAANFLKESFGTMIALANNLRAAYPGGGAEAVLMRVLGGISSPDPGKFSPDNSYFGSVEKLTAELSKTTDPDLAAIRRGAGVADYALARILFVLARSPKLEDATGALIRYARRQLATDPTNQLDTIGKLLDSGDAFKIAEATDMVNRLAAQSRQQQSALGSQIASIEKELTDASVALEALDYGKALFNEVTGTPEDRNPEYIQIRDKAIEWLNIRERMILSSGGNPRKFGDTSVGFQPFSVKTHDLEIKQDLLVIDAANEAVNKESNFARIQKWFKNANDYVLAFREADAAFQQDPVNNKSPDALGFDRVTYNGLEDAIAQEARYLDPVILFIDQKTENNLFTQWALGKAYFRQYLASVKEVNGQAGRDLLSAMTRYGNALNRSKVAYHNHIYDIRDARLAAVKSHGDFCNGDLEIYRKKIFNEMASEGRQFGEAVKVGMTLPVSGEKVTFEDIKLLKTLQAFYGDLRQLVTETEGRGVLEERGHAKAGTFRVFVRKAASVGEEGLPMTISGEGENLIKELTEAYVSEGEAGWPTASSDLSRNSGNRAVQFWNRHSDSLTRHILDAGRKFRSITQDRLMLIAEQRAAQELRQSNNPLAIQSLEDAIALIAKHLPQEVGVDPIAFVSGRLLEELHQYYVNTGSPAANMLPKSQGVGGMTIRSEFTQPAAQFHFPSDWYDYGSFTNSGLILMTARVMHEPIIEVNKALQRALAAIQGEINLVVEKRGKPVNYRNEREALRVKAIIEGTMGDLEKSWNLTDPDVARNGLELPPDIIKAGLLAPPTVNTRNLINGGGLVMLNLMQLHRWGRTMAMLGTFRHVAGAAARLPVDLMFSQNWPVGRFLKPYLVDNLRAFGSPMMTWLADKIVQSHVDNVAGLQSIGFSLRSPFLRSVMSMWKDTALYQTSLSGHLRRGKMAVTGRVLSNVVRTGTAAYRAIGAEYFDKIINSQSIGYTGTIEATLMELSDIYGAKREFLGEYNPADSKWLITPEEFSRRLLATDRVQNLAQFKAFLSGADMTLEDLMWKYYKAKKAFQKGERATEPSMFNEDQYNALRAAVVRAFNAGDALNRPTAIANNRFFRMFATFQGYSSNFLVNYMQAFNRARSQSWYENAAMAIPASIMFAATSVALALFSNAFNDEWKRKFQGSSQRQVTIFTKEFWTDYSNAKSAVLEAYLSMIPWLGDAALFARGVVVNNRGYEPTGRILVFGLMNGLFSTIRGMWNTAKAGDYANMMNPARDYLLQYAGYGKEIAYATSETYKAVKDYRAGQSVLGYVAEQNGIKDPKASQGSSNFVYGPTSGMREDMQSALMRRDYGALREAYAKMVAYYTNRGMKDPESIVNRDFEAMNPIIRGMGGKKPTDEQYDLIYSKMTDAQKESVNASLKAWDWGANVLGIQYNPISGQGGGSLKVPSIGRQSSPSRASSSGLKSPSSFRVRRISIGSARKSVGTRSRRLGLSSRFSKMRRLSPKLASGQRRPAMRRLRLA